MLRRPIETTGLIRMWPTYAAVFHGRCGNFPTNLQLTGEQISSEHNFRVGDHSPRTRCTSTLLAAKRNNPVPRKRACPNPGSPLADRFVSVYQTGGVLASD